jgi:ferritin-like protein
MAAPENFDDTIELLEMLLSAEEACVIDVRKGETEIFNFLEGRTSEFSNPDLIISPYDSIRNEKAKSELLAQVTFSSLIVYSFD